MAGTTVAFSAQEQVFHIAVSGLMPLTTHYMYYERQRVAYGDIKPLGQPLGESLVTDENGKLDFEFYYSTGITGNTAFSGAQALINSIGGRKEVVITSTFAESLPDKYYEQATSYCTTHLLIDVLTEADSGLTSKIATTNPDASGGAAAGLFDDVGVGGVF